MVNESGEVPDEALAEPHGTLAAARPVAPRRSVLATPGPVRPRICSATGVALVPAVGQRITRIVKSSYGPMNPLLRPAADEDRASWGRFDVAGHRTVYGGSPRQAAYAESLARFRPALAMPLTELFDDEDPATTVLEEVEKEWESLLSWRPGMLPRAWRDDRLEHTLTLPTSGWFVDIEHAATVRVVENALGRELLAIASATEGLTVAQLRGEDRSTTTAVAGWLRALTLDDGHRAHGIRYGSKHGSNWTCWAIWLRVVDDGSDPARDVLREPTTADAGVPIGPPERNPALQEVVDLFDLTCY